MAALSMEAACRAVFCRRLQSVWRITEVSGRQYHGCMTIARLRRARASGTQQLLVFTNARLQSSMSTAASQIPVVSESLDLVEQSVSELGLGGYTPPGLIQTLLESLHVDIGLPWWGCIVTATVVARILVFPLMVKGQRFAANMNNHMPRITELSNRMNEAKQSGNMFEFSKAYNNLLLYQKKHGVQPFRGLLMPMVQAPVFLSFFLALRQMSNLPVPSMNTGGLWWFADLTVADPYYILPLISASSMWAIMALGVETGVSNPNLKVMKNVFRVLPFFIFAFSMNFPAAVLTYWVTSNAFSIAQVGFLKIPAVRKKLNIPEQIKHDPSVLPDQGGFIENLKKGWKNAQMAHELMERESKIKNHLDMAAKGPLRQTFAQNPLQQRVKTPASADKSKNKPWQDTLG